MAIVSGITAGTALAPQRFRGDPYGNYRKSLLAQERVRELSCLQPWRIIIDTAVCWLTILTAWTLVALQPCWWTILLCIPIVGIRYYALNIIGHDGLHRRLFKSPRLNDLFNDLLILGPIGAITRINKENHINHHHHISTRLDPDRHKHGCFNKTNLRELLGYLAGITSVWRSVRNVFFTRKSSAATEESRRYTARELAIIGCWQVALISSLSLAIGWWGWPLVWLLPVYIFTFLADNLRSFAEHSQPERDAAADEHRLISFASNPLERLLLAPMNMNYHAVHHLWASIPYYNLPQADAEIRTKSAAADLEWRRSYLGYLWRYCRALPLHECKEKA
jgi:fatty acid desaturase